MSKNLSVIDIHGNTYDVMTGQLVGTVQRVANQVKTRTTEPIIDGVIRKASKTKRLTKQLNRSNGTGFSSTSFKERVKHSAQNIHQKTQYSHTIMRSAVRRPLAQQKPKTVSTNQASAISGEVVARPASRSLAVVKRTLPSNVVSQQQIERLLDHALAKADAHKQALRKRRLGLSWQRLILGSRWLTLTSFGLIVVLVGGFLAWNHIPYLSMKVAALRSNIHASVPGYTPSGFAFKGPILGANGSVILNFEAKDNNRAFSIKQESSNWDSDSLAANAVPFNAQVQTSQVKGNTIYIYSHGNKKSATWVNNGTRTTIENNANLRPDDILKIAEGL